VWRSSPSTAAGCSGRKRIARNCRNVRACTVSLVWLSREGVEGALDQSSDQPCQPVPSRSKPCPLASEFGAGFQPTSTRLTLRIHGHSPIHNRRRARHSYLEDQVACFQRRVTNRWWGLTYTLKSVSWSVQVRGMPLSHSYFHDALCLLSRTLWV